jgi:hypothetical protein
MHSLRSCLPLRLLLALAIAVSAASCGSEATSTTAPSPTTTTTSFTGTVAQLGSSGHAFTVTTTGPVTIGLTSLAPLATMAMGVGIGTWDGTTCGTAVSKNDNARSGSTALSGTASAGNYCVLVYDSGNILEGIEVSYTVDVTRP